MDNEATREVHIESGSERQVPAAVDEVSAEQCREQKPSSDTFESDVCEEEEHDRCRNTRAFVAKSDLHGPGPCPAGVLLRGFFAARKGETGRSSDPETVRVDPKRHVLQRLSGENQAQEFLRRPLAEMGSVFPSWVLL